MAPVASIALGIAFGLVGIVSMIAAFRLTGNN